MDCMLLCFGVPYWLYDVDSPPLQFGLHKGPYVCEVIDIPKGGKGFSGHAGLCPQTIKGGVL